MAKDWCFSTGSALFEQWKRSGQQLVQVPPGGVPVLGAPVDLIRKYDNGDVIVTPLEAINLRADELTFGPDQRDAAMIQEALYRIIARRVDPESLPPEERLPESVPLDGLGGFAVPDITTSTVQP